MIDTKELRRLAQAALAGPDGISLNWIKLLQDFQQSANPAAISELLDRLEAAEKEVEIERMRLAACGVAALGYFEGCAEEYISASLNDVLALRAKIEQMERQEPAWFIDERGEPKRYHKRMADYCKCGGLDLLYALPGAKGE